MKKLLLATSLLGALSTSAIAKEHGMYLRIDGNPSKLVDGISADNMKGGQLIKEDVSNKPLAFWVQGGVGSYLMDSFRIEANAYYLMDTDFDAVTPANLSAPANQTKTYVALAGNSLPPKVDNASSKITVGSYGLLGRVYFDIADLGWSKLFIGGTAGYSWTTVKQVLSGTVPNAENPTAPANISITTKSENYGDFAYGFNAGFSYAMTESSELNIEYSFLKVAEVKDDGASSNKNEYDTPYHVNAHNLNLGVRFYL